MRFKLLLRLLSLLLLIVAILPLCSCGEVRIVCDEAEIKAAAEDLIEKSVLWNEIFFIWGLRPLEGGRSPSDAYIEIDPAHLSELGFASVKEIREYGSEIFSPEMTAYFDEILFGAVKSDIGGIVSSAACMDYGERVSAISSYPVVNPDECPKKTPSGKTWGEPVRYLYETMRITYNLNYRATVELTVVGEGEENLGLTDTVTVQLERVDGKWYLDNLTVARIDK